MSHPKLPNTYSSPSEGSSGDGHNRDEEEGCSCYIEERFRVKMRKKGDPNMFFYRDAKILALNYWIDIECMELDSGGKDKEMVKWSSETQGDFTTRELIVRFKENCGACKRSTSLDYDATNVMGGDIHPCQDYEVLCEFDMKSLGVGGKADTKVPFRVLKTLKKIWDRIGDSYTGSQNLEVAKQKRKEVLLRLMATILDQMGCNGDFWLHSPRGRASAGWSGGGGSTDPSDVCEKIEKWCLEGKKVDYGKPKPPPGPGIPGAGVTDINISPIDFIH